MNTLDLELLRSLVAIVSHDSFAAAAVQLGRTQSAVTQQMQRLEEQIAQLLAGVDRASHLVEQLHLKQGRLEGTLRIGAPHDVADTMLPPLLMEVVRSSPMVQLDVHVGRSPFLMESLKRGEIDMAISNRLDAELDSVVLRTSPTVWLCGSTYVHDPARPLPMIMADGPSIFRRLAQEALDAAGVAWMTRYTSSSLIGIRAALRAGLGVTARGVEQLDSEMRVLGAAEGLPPLPPLVYRLYVRSRVVNPLTRQVFDRIRSRFH